MQLTTPIKVPKFPTITHSARVMMFGSCFATCIAERLARLRFEVIANPFGITYNPISIASAMARIDERRLYTEEELGENGGLFYSPDHHGSFSSATREETLDKINRAFSEASEAIGRTTHFIVTLGSSVVYEREGKTWNNCHKLPQREFGKRRLSVEEVVEALGAVVERHSDSRFILTVSPVRYIADNNSANKATLLLAAGRLSERYDNVTYFPAYEIMVDELRDYRFYADDMLHPSTLAEEIIFDRFAGAYFTSNTQRLNQEIARLATMKAHRPLHRDSEEYIRFKSNLQEYEKIVIDAVVRSRDADDDCTIR